MNRKKIDAHLKIALQISGAMLLMLLFVSFVNTAYASDNKKAPPMTQKQSQKQIVKSEQWQTTNSSSEASGGSAVNEGIDVNASDNSRIENNSSNVVLVPNNNTENCLRVFGIAWGKNGESGALGVPWRSKKCDYEQAADDAFAAGERETGWFWKCQNPNLYKSFQEKDESKELAKSKCLDSMLGGVHAKQTITSLTNQLETLSEERNFDRQQYTKSQEQLTAACNESKNRILESCRPQK